MKDTKEKDWVDKRVEEIQNWGLFSLMIYLKRIFEQDSASTRARLFYNEGRNCEYYGSPLEVHDTLTSTIFKKIEEEMAKLEKLKEDGII